MGKSEKWGYDMNLQSEQEELKKRLEGDKVRKKWEGKRQMKKLKAKYV